MPFAIVMKNEQNIVGWFMEIKQNENRKWPVCSVDRNNATLFRLAWQAEEELEKIKEVSWRKFEVKLI